MYNLGDVLSIQYAGFKHYGIYIGNNTLIHNSKKFFKVEEISLDDFKDGKEPNLSSIKSSNPELSIQQAKKYLGIPYGLFSENCEHFVRVVCGLEKESTQVQKYLITALGTGVLLKSDNTIVQAAGGAAAIGALLTSSEKSPVKNSAVLACLAAGVAFLATQG
jgi:hypothetical protein